MKIGKKRNKNILVLGYGEDQTNIISELRSKEYEVMQNSEKIEEISDHFDLVLSFGYRHLLTEKVISTTTAPIINLHLSFLPWNRGAHPNFWSFWDNTPSGVTIHKIDPGVDTGPILFQRYFEFDTKVETFKTTYEKLVKSAEALLFENFERIINHDFELKKQRGKGTYHSLKDLPQDFSGWDTNIATEIERLESLGFNSNKHILNLIDEIESTRSRNNVNWMNLLRVVAVEAPDKLVEITSKINESDDKISTLFKKLSEK
jgi:methionyl-tRNA formyltransferase